MSRTHKGSKSGGYEYWSRRPFNRSGALPGAEAKKRTHKAERKQAEAQIEEAMTELDAKNDEPCPCCGRHCGLEPEVCEDEVFDLTCITLNALENNHE